ncbi:MAG: replication restart helicase PriA, partial [Chitinophagaceae bacterium]
MKYVVVILPLALPKNYTYALPEEYLDRVKIGTRVAVNLGKSKKYSGIVKEILDTQPAYVTKPILGIFSEEEVVYSQQLKLWEWIAQYYMCSEGEVMNAALPVHFKLSSETQLLYKESFGLDFSTLDEDEFLVAEALLIRKELTLIEVQQILDRSDVFSLIKDLLDKGVCQVYEDLKETYRQKLEKFISLNVSYQEEEKLKELFDDLSRAPKQLELLLAFLHLYKTEGEVRQSELLKKSGASAAQLKGLIVRNILMVEQRGISRIGSLPGKMQLDFLLNEQQQRVLTSILEQFEQKQVVLLHGVTSSGKTLVYIKLMEHFLEQGKQILYLLPEIALTSQIIRRLEKYFGGKVGVYHSRFSNNERVEIWNKVKSGEIQILLGARSSLLLPFKNLGLVILDEEQDASFKQQDPAPRYHARDTAIYYAQLFGASVVIGSATPSVESYFHALQGKYGWVELRERYGGMEMPEMIIVDAKLDAFRKLSIGNFTSVLKSAMDQALEAGKQVILFQNRRGYAPYQVCSVCGWIPHCKNCDVSLTYHKYHDKLHCHYCGQQYGVMVTCMACGNQKMESKSFGTEKIEDELTALYPKARIGRMDVDAVRSKEGHNKIIQLFEQQRLDILVGTQMVVKGLDFEHVSLVGILQADSLLNYPDFRVNERAFQLMEQVAGRAGRKGERGKVIIQANQIGHPILTDVVSHDYLQMYEKEISQRRLFNYPPFSRLTRITLKHKNQDLVDQAARELGESLPAQIRSIMLGPSQPLVGKVRNFYLQELLFKLPRETHLIRG